VTKQSIYTKGVGRKSRTATGGRRIAPDMEMVGCGRRWRTFPPYHACKNALNVIARNNVTKKSIYTKG
jgi:hypothetical protein